MQVEKKQYIFRYLFFSWGVFWGIAYILEWVFYQSQIYRYVQLGVLILLLLLIILFKFIYKENKILNVYQKAENAIKYLTYAMLIPFIVTLVIGFMRQRDTENQTYLIILLVAGIALVVISSIGVVANILTYTIANPKEKKNQKSN